MNLNLNINSNCLDRQNSPGSRTQSIPPLSPCQSCLPSATHARCALDHGLFPRQGVKSLGTSKAFSWAQTLTFADRIGQHRQGWACHSTVLHNLSRNQFLSLVDASPGSSWVIGQQKESQACRDSPRSSPVYGLPLISLCNCIACSTFTTLCRLKQLFYSMCFILSYGEQHLKQNLVSLTKRESIYSCCLISPN